jgi:hypothetical protein
LVKLPQYRLDDFGAVDSVGRRRGAGSGIVDIEKLVLAWTPG